MIYTNRQTPLACKLEENADKTRTHIAIPAATSERSILAKNGNVAMSDATKVNFNGPSNSHRKSSQAVVDLVRGITHRSKLDMVRVLLSRREGATTEELSCVTAWLPHTVRASLTRLRMHGFRVVREVAEDGLKRYRITAGPDQEMLLSAQCDTLPAPIILGFDHGSRSQNSTQERLQASTNAVHAPAFKGVCASTDVVRTPSNWRAVLARMDGAYSVNTTRCYRGDFNIFEAWRMDRGRSALPATPATVAEFLRGQNKSAASAAISRRRAAIAKIHRLMRFDSPVSDEEVSLAARAVFREKGRRQKQALGLTCLLKQKIVDACASDLHGLRDRAPISVGYDTLCRRSELVQLRIEDLVTRPDGSATILVRKSKTDQLGNGRLAYLSADTFKYVQLWLAAVDLGAGPIFRPIYAAGVPEDTLCTHAVSRVIKRRATDAGIDPGQVRWLTGRSMRVGAAQDMAAAGIELTALMHAGGWKSPEMVMRYIEHMDVAKSGIARLYDRRSTAPHIEANKDWPIGNPR